MKGLLAFVTCAALGTGCFSVTYQNRLLPPNGVVHDGTSSFYVLGLIGTERIPAYELCPHGVSRIETELTFVDVLLTVFTAGIYTPRSYAVECGGMR